MSDCPSILHRIFSRRLLQISLRSVFILLTIVCVWLGVISYRVQKMKRAISAIRSAHGGINYELYHHDESNSMPKQRGPARPPRGPAWVRRLLGEEFFDDVVTVDFRNVHVRPEQLAPLHKFPQLEELDLGYTPSRDLSPLAGLLTLRQLTLDHSEIDDTQLQYVGQLPQLTHLWLDDTATSDSGLKHLQGLAQLRVLSLRHTRVTEVGVADLRQALPGCQIYSNLSDRE